MAGENSIGEIPVLITGDYSNLEAAISSAVGAAEKGADSIAQAFDQPDVGNALSTSLSNIGDSADQAAAQIVPMADAVQGLGNESQTSGTSVEGLGHSVEQAGESAHEAESQFSELTQELLKLGGISLSIEGLKELVTESISAYASVQRATEAITAMTHSAETANEIIEKLKALSLSDAVAFPSLITAEQRFVAMKVELEKIPAALNAIADSSRATARDFETVAVKMENIAQSGALMPRTLIALGLSIDDVARAMGVAADEVKAAFKDLDETERVQVLTTALQKYAGLAESTANDIAGSWQRLKNQADFTFEEIGKAIAPAASGIMSFASEAVLPAVNQIVEQFSRVIEVGGRLTTALEAIWKNGGLIEYLNSIYEGLNKITGLDSRMQAVGGWATLFHDVANAIIPGANAAELLADALDKLTGRTPALENLGRTISDATSKAAKSLGDLGDGFNTAVRGAEEWAKSATKVKQGADDLGKSAKVLKDSFEDFAGQQKEADATLARALDTYTKIFQLFEQGKASADLLQRAQDALNRAWTDANPALVQLQKDAEKGQQALGDLSDAVEQNTITVINGTKVTQVAVQSEEDLANAATSAGESFLQSNEHIKVLTGSVADNTTAAVNNSSATQSLADTWIYMNGAWENAADLAEKVTHGMMDEADEAYKAATAVNTFAQAERDAAAAADKLASSSKGSKFGGGGSGGGGDKRFSWSMDDPSSNGFGGGGSDGSISLQGYLEDLISFATSPLASANGALPQSVIDGLALLAGGMTGTGGRLPDGGGSIGPLSTAAEAATKSITNLAAATNIQTSNLTDQQKITILLNSGMKLYGDATGAVTAALSDVAGAAGDAANALDNVGSGPGGSLTAGEQAQVAQMKGDQPPDSSGFWAKDAQGRWYRTDLPVSQSSIDASNNGIANLDQATGKWVAAVKLGAETFNVAADSSRDAYNAIQDAINRFVETGTTKLPVAQAGVMAQVAAHASDGIAQFDAASGKWVGTLHVGTQVLNVAASTAQQAYDQMQVAMQRFANTGTFNVPTVQAGALGSGASGGNRFGQTNLPSGLSIDQMEANLNKGLPATFGQYGSVSVPITVQAGTVVGVNGMGQLAQMVGDEVIKNLRQVAGLKL